MHSGSFELTIANGCVPYTAIMCSKMLMAWEMFITLQI